MPSNKRLYNKQAQQKGLTMARLVIETSDEIRQAIKQYTFRHNTTLKRLLEDYMRKLLQEDHKAE